MDKAPKRHPRTDGEVLKKAYDNVVDALMERPDLGVGADGRPVRMGVEALAEKNLGWRRAEDVRRAFAADGNRREGPRNAVSLDAPHTDVVDGSTWTLGDRVASTTSFVDQVHFKLQFDEMLARSAAAGTATHRSVVAYLVGADPDQVAAAAGGTREALYQRKSRFVRGNRDLAA